MKVRPNEYFMKLALQEAALALAHDEVPVGAVVVLNNMVIARGHNQVELLTDATAHAEMIALTAAGNAIKSKYLDECSIFISLEPCPMCAAALNWARIGQVIFAAADSKNGYTRISRKLLHPKTEVSSGLMEVESAIMLREFFKKKRV